MTVLDYIKSKGWNYHIAERSQSGTQYVMQCPFCHGDGEKFAINANTGAYNCLHENACGVKGGFEKLQKEMGDKPERLEHPGEKYVKIKENKIKYNKPTGKTFPLKERARSYLNNKRKLTNETIDYFKISTGEKGEIVFPHIKNGEVVNLKHYIPAYNDNKKKMWQEENCEPILFNMDNVEGSNYLIITEGEIDCMTLFQYGFRNVTSLPSGVKNLKFIENNWDFLNKFNEIYLCLDSDDPGKNAVMSLVARLGNWRCKNVSLPLKDANECLKNDITKEDIFRCIENAETFAPVELKSAGSYAKEVVDIIEHPERYIGEETGIPELTDIIRGWRFGEVTLWTGQPASGKSTLLNQVNLFLARRGHKICIASLELRAARFLTWAAIQCLNSPNPKKSKVVDFFEWIDSKWFIVDLDDNVKPTKLFDIMEYAAQRFGVKFFTIDSLMKIELDGSDTNKAQTRFMNSILAFAKRLNVHVHLVAHPKKLQSDSSVPDRSDISGTSNIGNLADNTLSLWRRPVNEALEENISSDAILYIKKHREFGNLGKVDLYVDPVTKRFTCAGQENIFY